MRQPSGCAYWSYRKPVTTNTTCIGWYRLRRRTRRQSGKNTENIKAGVCGRAEKTHIHTYRLVSNADNNCCKYHTTWSRICDSFPIVTCSYIKCAVHTTVSVGKMQSLSKNYPTVMMTSAFAFLIPNKDETFCTLLKKSAYAFHQYEFFATVSGLRMHTSNVQSV